MGYIPIYNSDKPTATAATTPRVGWWHRAAGRKAPASTVTAVWGIAHQILGAEFLVRLGYEYNTVVRSAGPLLRSFSTFIQPFPFGLYVLMGILVGGSVALQDLSRIRNRLFLAAMPVLIVGMGMSIVRAAFLGLIVGMIWLTSPMSVEPAPCPREVHWLAW